MWASGASTHPKRFISWMIGVAFAYLLMGGVCSVPIGRMCLTACAQEIERIEAALIDQAPFDLYHANERGRRRECSGTAYPVS